MRSPSIPGAIAPSDRNRRIFFAWFIAGTMWFVAAAATGCVSQPAESAITADVDSTPTESVIDDAEAPAHTAPDSTPHAPTQAPSPTPTSSAAEDETDYRSGLAHLAEDEYRLLEGRRVGVVTNTTGQLDGTSIVDLLADHVDLQAIFAPEHGLRANADAGEAVTDGVDPVTGLPVHSLYGETRKPTPEMMSGLDVIVYDIQDVGCRCYTYISTLGLAMQAAAEQGIAVVVLDRANPNPYVSGFVRDLDQESFVSQYPIPLAYGLSSGQLAEAIVGEGWMSGLEGLDLTVVASSGTPTFDPWVPPSPALPTHTSALVYPGTVLFEATILSIGRGTDEPFVVVGAPWVDAEELVGAFATWESELGATITATTITPQQLAYMSAPPKFAGETVPAVEVTITDPARFDPAAVAVVLLSELQGQNGAPIIDRPDMFDLLAGTTRLRTMLADDATPEEIIASWQPEAQDFATRMATYRSATG